MRPPRIRWGRRLRPAVIPAFVAVALLIGSLTSVPQDAGTPSQKPAEKVTIDGKVYEKKAAGKVRFTAKDLELAHDAVTHHGVGQAITTPVVFTPWVPTYGSEPDWWMEAEAFILHRQEVVGNPPIQLDYYRGGFEWASWRGDWDETYDWFGPNQFLALNNAGIYLALVEHPLGGTLTTNLRGPHKISIPSGQPGSYTCDYLTGEVGVPYDPDTVVRTNLVVQPNWKYWDGIQGIYRNVPYGSTRRMTHSEGLIADGTDTTVQEAYTDTWSGFVSIPSGASSGNYCAPEVIDEPN